MKNDPKTKTANLFKKQKKEVLNHLAKDKKEFLDQLRDDRILTKSLKKKKV